MKLPFQMDLSAEVAVVTGGGGVLCSMFSKALAALGAKVAVLDIKLEAAEAVASAIRQAGGQALAIQANCLDKQSLEKAHEQVLSAFGPCTLTAAQAAVSERLSTRTAKNAVTDRSVRNVFDFPVRCRCPCR